MGWSSPAARDNPCTTPACAATSRRLPSRRPGRRDAALAACLLRIVGRRGRRSAGGRTPPRTQPVERDDPALRSADGGWRRGGGRAARRCPDRRAGDRQ
jgi:hypothetical protein